VGLHNTARSADPDGSRRDAADGLAADLGDRIAHVWTGQDQARISTLDLVGPGLTLLTDEYGGRWRHELPSVAATIASQVVDAAAARALGIHGGGAVLVRPDAKPVATWTAAMPEPAGAITAAVTAMAMRTTQVAPARPRMLAG
jgi:hypothetical protein